MRTLLILIALSTACFSQTQGHAPQVADTVIGSRSAVPFAEGTQPQDLIICDAVQSDVASGCAGGSNSGWQFQDSLSNNLTMLTIGNNGGAVGSINTFYGAIGYICATATNFPYQVNWTSGGSTSGCTVSFQCTRVKNMCSAGSVTTDGSVVNTSHLANSSAVNTVSNNFTTTSLNDFVFSFGKKAEGNGGSNKEQAIGQLSELTYDNNVGSGWEIAPVLGSNSVSWSDVRGVNNRTFAQTIPFIVPMKLGDSVLHDAGAGTAYYEILHPYGGVSATPTFACTGLPANGLSLNTATGEITGTPTSQGTLSLSCTFNDGITTSPADSLTLTIGGSFRSPARNGSTQIKNFGNGGGNVTVTGTNCGDVIILQALAADDTHGSNGIKQVIDGTHGNSVTSSDGSPVQEYVSNTGSLAGPIVVWVVGPLVSGGTKTISVVNSISVASGITVLVSDWSNVQSTLSVAGLNNIIATNNPTAESVSYTTAVPNEVVAVSAYSGSVINASLVTSTSLNSPFVSDGNGSATFFYYQFGHYISPTATTLTPTFNVTETNWGCGVGNIICDPMTMLVTSLRPRLPILACGETTGTIRHTAQIY